jgi:methylated-DNA-[protein]-cysteine S-methyltransferase
MTTQMPVRYRSHAVLDSPIGPLTLVADGDALSGLYMNVPGHQPDPSILGEPAGSGRSGCASPVLRAAAGQLQAYFAGQLTGFDLPLALEGTRFQRTVWAELQAIGYGETISYGQLADRIGQPTASRAVGLANGRNPVSIVVPCHRVVGATGSLTGYGGGLDRKRYLLALEQRVSGQTLA